MIHKMPKVVTIHQPNYLPWLGFFAKAKRSDVFVILDTVEYSKNSVINRNKIRIKDGWCYLTIPVEKKYHEALIKDVALPSDGKWQKNHWATIEANYGKAEFFTSHRDFFKGTYEKDYRFLHEINTDIIKYLMECFRIHPQLVKASELGIDPSLKKTDLLLDILKKTGASKYLSGPSGKDYLEEGKFEKEGVSLEYFSYPHPEYKQRYQGFVPNLSAIDLLFNLGEKSAELL
jgi:hypothetical protein